MAMYFLPTIQIVKQVYFILTGKKHSPAWLVNTEFYAGSKIQKVNISMPLLSAENDNTLTRFMELTISQINKTLTHLHAVEQVLVSNGLVTEEAFIKMVRSAEELPDRIDAQKILQEMIANFNKKVTDEKHS